MRIFGHPIHPLLVHFPIALWTICTISDGAALIGYPQAWPFTGMLLAISLALAIPAMIAGIYDYVSIEDAAASVAQYHLILMSSAWSVYLAALLTRLDGSALLEKPIPLSIALSGVGLFLMILGGWFGGQLVYHHGVGTRFQNHEPDQP